MQAKEYIPPPSSWQATLTQALYDTYMNDLQRLIERKAKYWEAMASTDRFKLSEDENRRLQKRLDDLAAEIEILDRATGAISDMSALYAQHLDNLTQERNSFRAMYRSASKSENALISILQSEMTR